MFSAVRFAGAIAVSATAFWCLSLPAHAAAMPPVLDPWQTVLIEHQDRKARLARFALREGLPPPQVEEYFIEPSEHHVAGFPTPIPVLRVVFSERVFFDFDKTDLLEDAYAVLNTIAGSLQREPPDVTVFVAGHTDAIGTVNYNLGLGLRRARAVSDAITAFGINRAQMYLISFGKAAPAVPNDSIEGRARNRRVEFLFAARPEPIGAWLSRQPVLTCTPDASQRRDNCPVDLTFKAVPVPIAVPPSTPTSVSIPQEKTDVSQPARDTEVSLRPSVMEIDLRRKVFTMRPPE